MKRYLLVVALIIGTCFHTFAAFDIFDDIANAIRSGDSKSIARFFGNTIDLTISNQEEVYSKTQAEQILRDFFAKNNPKSFVLIHRGESKENARYAIGKLVTGQNAVYRIYFYIKQHGNTAVVQEIRFMQE